MSKWIDVPSEAKYGRSVPFRGINEVCYDSDAKEIVRVSNGNCIKSHGADYDGHMGTPGDGCIYAPSEAVAFRLIGITVTKDPIVAMTYRGVRPEALSPMPDQGALDFVKDIRRSRFAGRI